MGWKINFLARAHDGAYAHGMIRRQMKLVSGTGTHYIEDGTYFNLEPHEHVTAWLALSEADEASGCMQVSPGSHVQGQLDHIQGPTESNLLSNGQVLGETVAEADLVLLPVPAGHFSLHHTHLVHASPPNRSEDRRIGLGISYIPTRVRHTSPVRQTAMLVRGEDRFGHFDPEVRPEADFDAAARARHAQSCAHFFDAHGSTRTAEEDASANPG